MQWEKACFSFQLQCCNSPLPINKRMEMPKRLRLFLFTSRTHTGQRRTNTSLPPTNSRQQRTATYTGPPSLSQKDCPRARKPTCGQTHCSAGGSLWADPPLFLCVLLLQASLLSRNICLAKVLAMLKHCFPHHLTAVTVNSLVIWLYLLYWCRDGCGS